ncbi:helix-turn-helix domain-containing protein [Mediterraneibacter gnavus]|uniref:MerR family transcriptional regulator n=1 Tax=Mediterraneibacter gnavus TaxID=33038 RepID=UPI001A9B425F|nr:helix-turn-helix domain-containing protein [Mediterraneibacter gnavus]
MLSIGEFSKICKVSTKTLRYYDEIGLINPSKINQENGYRYYSIEQLETMLLINRLKQYNFSLEEIKAIITSEEIPNEKLSIELYKKKSELEKQIQIYSQITEQLNEDIAVLKQGKSIMSYLNKIDVQLVEIPTMYLVSVRKMVYKFEMEEQYACCFNVVDLINYQNTDLLACL